MIHAKTILIAVILALLGGCVSSGQPRGSSGIGPVDVKETTLAKLNPGPIQWHKGDRWDYSDGYSLQVAEVNHAVARLDRLDSHGDWIERDGLFKVGSKSGDTIRRVVYRNPDPHAFFPLKEGKKIEFMQEYLANKQLRVHQTSWNVAGKERIAVPAGAFDCWVLELETRSTISDWVGREKWWYSPLVGNFVRMEFSYGKNKPSSRVLTHFVRGISPLSK